MGHMKGERLTAYNFASSTDLAGGDLAPTCIRPGEIRWALRRPSKPWVRSGVASA